MKLLLDNLHSESDAHKQERDVVITCEFYPEFSLDNQTIYF